MKKISLALLLGSASFVASSCSCEKKVKIEKFCINGDADVGASGEHQIRLDGNRYYPLTSANCNEGPEGYCAWRENQCHNLPNGIFVNIDKISSLVVGQEEYDSTSQNDSNFATLVTNDWYNSACEAYEVQFAVEFSASTMRQVCWNVGGEVSGNAGNAQGSINAGVESCTTWTDPAESYIWLMRVEPVDASSGACSSPEPGCGFAGRVWNYVRGDW